MRPLLSPMQYDAQSVAEIQIITRKKKQQKTRVLLDNVTIPSSFEADTAGGTGDDAGHVREGDQRELSRQVHSFDSLCDGIEGHAQQPQNPIEPS